MLRILLISDIRLYREGLAQILMHERHIRVVKAVPHVEQAICDIQALSPDIVLLDMATANPVPGVRAIMQQCPDTKVVAIGVSEREEEIVRCAEAGVSGFVFRNDSVEDLVKAAEGAVCNELQCPNRIASMLLHRVSELATQDKTCLDNFHLTPREFKILELIEKGLTNKAIAARLVIEVATVKNHVHNLLEKLNVHTRGEAVAKLRLLDQKSLHRA